MTLAHSLSQYLRQYMRQSLRLGALLMFTGPACWAATAPDNSAAHPVAGLPLPPDSVYQLPLGLTDQQGRTMKLADKRGQPLLVSMFYTSCEFVCPMLVEALNQNQTGLSADERQRISVLLVSFDPKRDTVAVLQHTAQERSLDPAHWTLARTDAQSVRKLAAVLGIQYRAMPNGEFNHSTQMILLDAEGRIIGRSSQLGAADPAFAKRIKASVQAQAH
jgi:protein SCO1/2